MLSLYAWTESPRLIRMHLVSYVVEPAGLNRNNDT